MLYQNSRNIVTSSSFFSVATAIMDPSQLISIEVYPSFRCAMIYKKKDKDFIYINNLFVQYILT